MTRTAAICIALVASVWFVYGQVRTFEFVTYDDPDYVTENASIRLGLSAEGWKYALTTPVMGFYHPITMLTLLADYELYGLDPKGYHLGNIFLHALNTLLLFGWLRFATGREWASAAVAALFAVHPLHVESVAWIAERKDVLSTCFGLGCLWAYAAWARLGDARLYWASVALLAAGLLSKSMLVTIPVLMLLLDRWPLERLKFPTLDDPARAWWARVEPFLVEKWPFIAAAGAASAATLWIQHAAGAMGTRALEDGSVGLSWAAMPNVIVGYARYIAMNLWPTELMVLYPHPTKPHAGGIAIEPWQVVVAGSFLVLASVAVARMRRPAVAVGWLWYLVALLPVIGIVQIGSHALADRYTYLPSIGLFVIVCFGLAHWLDDRPAWASKSGLGLAAAAVLAIGAYAVTARSAASVWRDSETLYTHAIAINPRNVMMHYNLGNLVRARGETERSMALFREVIRIDPGHYKAHINLGEALAAKNEHAAAVEEYLFALRIKPENVIAHNNLANSLKSLGRDADAEKHYRIAIAQNDGNPLPHYNFGNLLLQRGDYAEAEAQYRSALALDPNHAGALGNLGNTLIKQGRMEEAAATFRRALAVSPGSEVAQRGLQIASAGSTRAVSAPPDQSRRE